MAVGVGGHAVDAALLHDGSLAAELVEQPFGAELRIFDLIVGQHIGLRRRDGLIDGDHNDALVSRLLDDGVERLAVARVDDDDVGAGGNQVADVGDLLGGTAVAVGDDHLGDHARSLRLGLDRADHFLAPTIADQRVGDADHIFAGGLRGARRQQQRGDGCCREFTSILHVFLPESSGGARPLSSYNFADVQAPPLRLDATAASMNAMPSAPSRTVGVNAA